MGVVSLFPNRYLLCCTGKVFLLQRTIIESIPGLEAFYKHDWKQTVQRRTCCVLTNTSGLLSAPVRRGGVAAGQHLWALQSVAGEAVEEGLTAGVQVCHCDLSTRGLFGEGTTQYKSCKGDKQTDRERGQGEN